MKKFYLLFLLLFAVANLAGTQNSFVLQNKKGKDKIRFKLINNLIVIPVEVNGVKLSFLLDTGVSKPIFFNFLNGAEALKIKQAETLLIRGLGGGDAIKAVKSKKNVVKIGDAIKLNQELYAIYGRNFDFAPKLGVPIHGIIGYDLLKDFTVEINYYKRYLTLHNPYEYQYKSCNTCEMFNLEFHNNKPYMYAMVGFDKKQIPVKLLIDTGGSDALWLFENDEKGIIVGDYFDDFLGFGLNGSVYGKRSKIDMFGLRDFQLYNVNVAFPNDDSIRFNNMMKDRDGTLAGDILKRFNLVIDYRRKKITLNRNGNFKSEFEYNKSGIIIEYVGYRLVKTNTSLFGVKNRDNANSNSFNTVLSTKAEMKLKPAYGIVQLRENSPAEKAGLHKGDIILSINGKHTQNYSLQDIMQFFHDDNGMPIKLTVDRNGKKQFFSFKLKDPLNKKPRR